TGCKRSRCTSRRSFETGSWTGTRGAPRSGSESSRTLDRDAHGLGAEGPRASRARAELTELVAAPAPDFAGDARAHESVAYCEVVGGDDRLHELRQGLDDRDESGFGVVVLPPAIDAP